MLGVSISLQPHSHTPVRKHDTNTCSFFSGVAVGSSIGHALGGWFGGSSSAQPEQGYEQPASDAYAQPMDSSIYGSQGQTQSQAGYGSATQQPGPCAGDVKNFTKCMDENQGNLTICGWYFDQLKACQMAARQY